MADPVSITASIVAMLQISGAVIQTSYQYLHSIKDRRNDIRRIIDELSNLNNVLLSLDDLARDETATGDARILNLEGLLNSSDSPLHKCQAELLTLQLKLSQPVTSFKGLGKTLVWPLKEKETQRTLEVIRAQRGTCDLALNVDNTALSLVIHDDVTALRESLASNRTDDRNEKLIRWYTAVDPSSNHLAACEKHEPTTGEWFLTSAEFASWLTSPRSFLWLHGIPGCGKTVLSSTIIEKVLKDYGNKPNTAIAYFYFDFAESKKQSIKSCLSSLIGQVCCQRISIPEDVRTLYDRHKSSTILPLITNLLAVLTAATERLEVFLIFDALDECAERDYLMDVLSNLESGSCGNIKILATSRRERDIELAILPLVQDHVSIQDEKIEGDIRLFVVNSIANGAKMRRWPTAVKTEVEYALVQGAKGMFRWVKCQFDVLRNCTTVRDVKKSLITLPPTLDETYERILLNIDRAEREKVRIALQWLIFSERPLRLEEISEGVVVDPGSVSFSTDDRMFEPHDIVSICRSLVSLSDGTSELRLAHYSVQEYLLGERIREGPVSFFGVFEAPSQVLIAEVCLTYILLFDKPDSLSENSLSEWPLLDYACRHWFHHARKLGDIPDRYGATKLANKLFTPDGRFSFLNWLRVFEPDTPWIDFNPHKDPSPFATPLYYASFCGLLDIVKSLLANGADITARGGNYIKPLNAATTENSDTASRFLIENGAEVNITDNTGRRPLHNACIHGNAELARILLESGADVEARDSAGGSSMHISCFEGDIRIVRVLVEYDAEIDGRAHFTRDNLEPGSSLEARWNIGRTPLMEAAWNGQEEMVQLLLEMGADINAVDDHGMTSLIRAARRGHEKVVQKLLSHGADTSVKDKKGRTYEDWLERK